MMIKNVHLLNLEDDDISLGGQRASCAPMVTEHRVKRARRVCDANEGEKKSFRRRARREEKDALLKGEDLTFFAKGQTAYDVC